MDTTSYQNISDNVFNHSKLGKIIIKNLKAGKRCKKKKISINTRIHVSIKPK